MLGAITTLGRMTMPDIIRQVGREFGRRAMQALLEGEAVETVLTREEIKS